MGGIKSKVEMVIKVRQLKLSNEQFQFLKKIHIWLLKNKDVLASLPYFDKRNISVEDSTLIVNTILTEGGYYLHHIFFLNNLRHFYIRERCNKLFDYDI